RPHLRDHTTMACCKATSTTMACCKAMSTTMACCKAMSTTMACCKAMSTTMACCKATRGKRPWGLHDNSQVRRSVPFGLQLPVFLGSKQRMEQTAQAQPHTEQRLAVAGKITGKEIDAARPEKLPADIFQ